MLTLYSSRFNKTIIKRFHQTIISKQEKEDHENMDHAMRFFNPSSCGNSTISLLTENRWSI